MGYKSIFSIIAVFVLNACIDPYVPKLAGYESLMVVEGLITDSNTSYTVKLSRTFMEQNASPSAISDAIVYISDEESKSSYLKYAGSGKYKTDSTEFKGVIGKTYILHIIAGNGSVYESDPYKMESVPAINNVYYLKEQQFTNNGTATQDGIRIYLDSEAGDNNQYFRWAFEETWKFKVPNPKRYDFLMTDSSIRPVTNVKEYCWKSRKSDEILVHAGYEGHLEEIKKIPVYFIASDKSDRLLLQYSILVSQYSVSKSEYEYWNNLRQVNDDGGDIFARQPFTVISNIHNVNNPTERVLGYFQVSAVKLMRKTIPYSEISSLNLPFYHYPCERIEKDPMDFQTEWGPPMTWADVYRYMSISSDYIFVEPRYASTTNGELVKMIFTRAECADCELTGTMSKPDFWIDQI